MALSSFANHMHKSPRPTDMTPEGGAMEYPPLQALWCEDRRTKLRCSVCRNEFTSERALIRTFKVQPSSPCLEERGYSTMISVPGQLITIYDRCLQCLISSNTEYITISHVWHPEVSKAQNAGQLATPPAHLQALVYALPIKLYYGITESIGENHEVWHDYISVPQWNRELKTPILRAIPQLYSKAYFTLVHLHDVSPKAVALLRAASSEDRVKGMTSICNGIWFRRIWTAMEYVRSERVRVMLDDYRIFQDVKDLFLREMNAVWADETVRQGNVHEVEGMATDGNLVVWRLGPLDDIGILRETSFGHAFSLLSRRLCTQKHDFFYALLGIVKADLDKFDDNDSRACGQIAKNCLEAGDYSPLLVLPRLEAVHNKKFHGYHDVRPWGLGRELSPPSLKKGLSLGPRTVALSVEKVGVIHFARQFRSQAFAEPEMLAHLASMALDYTGPNLTEFVSTLGTRMCGQDAQEILNHLSSTGKRQQMERALVDRYDSPRNITWPISGDKGIKWVAKAMGLSDTSLMKGAGKLGGETPLGFIRSRGGTIHGGLTGSIIGATCESCRRRFLFRAALSKPPSGVLNATAYRIPGLDYAFSLKNGVGIIVQDGKTIGRMVWARPACDCHVVENLELEYPEWEMPDPNEFMYGGK